MQLDPEDVNSAQELNQICKERDYKTRDEIELSVDKCGDQLESKVCILEYCMYLSLLHMLCMYYNAHVNVYIDLNQMYKFLRMT